LVFLYLVVPKLGVYSNKSTYTSGNKASWKQEVIVIPMRYHRLLKTKKPLGVNRSSFFVK
jgi:hypothetical protein